RHDERVLQRLSEPEQRMLRHVRARLQLLELGVRGLLLPWRLRGPRQLVPRGRVVLVLRHHGRHRALRLLSVAVASACAACSGQGAGGGAVGGEVAAGRASAAITNGAATSPGGDLGVAALMQGGTLLCTATLVSPRVLLTAAHCLAGSD